MAVGGLLDAWLVSLTGTQAVQNLVVTEVAGRVQREVLVAVLLRQTQSDFASKDQVKLTEVLQALDDSLVGNENSAVELRNKESEELGACLHNVALVIFVPKHMIEVSYHRLKQFFDELISQPRLELEQEVVAINEFLVVMSQWLFNVELDLVVEDLG